MLREKMVETRTKRRVEEKKQLPVVFYLFLGQQFWMGTTHRRRRRLLVCTHTTYFMPPTAVHIAHSLAECESFSARQRALLTLPQCCQRQFLLIF